VSESEAALHGDNMGQATLGWIVGCLTIWSSLFAIGNFLYGRTPTALLLTAVFVASGSVLIYVVNWLWDKDGAVASSARGSCHRINVTPVPDPAVPSECDHADPPPGRSRGGAMGCCRGQAMVQRR